MPVLRHSAAYCEIGKDPGDAERRGVESEEWESARARIYIYNLIKARKIADAFGADFITFFQPMLAFEKPLVGREIKRLTHYPFETEPGRRIRDKISLAADKLTRSGALPFIDRTDIYDAVGDVVLHDLIHTLQFAKPTVVRAICEKVLTRFDHG